MTTEKTLEELKFEIEERDKKIEELENKLKEVTENSDRRISEINELISLFKLSITSTSSALSLIESNFDTLLNKILK